MSSTRHTRNASRDERHGTILLVGAGALGCPALAVLSRSQIAKISVIDPDRVELANLPPQLLYDDADVGRLKVQAAAARLGGRGPVVEPIADRLTENNAHELVSAHDLVIDACDDPATKFLINRIAVNERRPFCYAGLSRTGGLALTVVPGASACLACVFPELAASTADESRDFGCHETGIVAPVAAVLGSFQAHQALGMLGFGKAVRPGRLAMYQLRGRRWQFIDFERDRRCAVCAAADTDDSRRTEPCHS